MRTEKMREKAELTVIEPESSFRGVQLVITALIAVLVSACTTPDGLIQADPAVEETAPVAEIAEPGPDLPDLELSPEILYGVLVAEIAGHRGQFDVSLDYYTELARLTRDPRIAERASRIAVYRRDDARALESARIWVETAPQEADARQVLAAVLIRSGLVTEAIEHLTFLLDQEPEEMGQRFKMIAALLGRDEDKQLAVNAMEKLVLQHPESADALFAFAHLILRAGDLERARGVLEEVLQRTPDNSSAVTLYLRTLQRLGQSEKALVWLKGQLKKAPKDFDLRLLYARLLVDTKDYKGAREQFMRLAKAQPDNADAQYGLALLHLQASFPEEARHAFDALIKIGERTDAAYYYLGQIDEAQGKPVAAIEHYHGVQAGEHFFESQIRVAVLLSEEGDLDAGRQQLRAIPTETTAQAVRIIRAEAELLTDAGQYVESIAVYEQALEKYPDEIDLLYGHAMVAIKDDGLDILEHNLHRILELEPNNVLALNALGYTLADKTDRYAEAYEYVQKALEQEPDDYFVLDSMGWVLYRLGRHEEALVYLRRASAKSNDAEIAAHLGEVLWVAGEQSEAQDVWNGALAISPDDERILDAIKRLSR